MIDRDDTAGEPFVISSSDSDSSPPLRQRVRERLGVSRRQWEYLVAGSIAVPYGLAIGLYIQFNLQEETFLLATSLYSFVAMYGSYKL